MVSGRAATVHGCPGNALPLCLMVLPKFLLGPGLCASGRWLVCCSVVWRGVPKALLPKGKGRDVYPRVQVNGLGCVCCVRAVCKCVVA